MSTKTGAVLLLSIYTLSTAIQQDTFGIVQLYKSVDNGLDFEPGWNTVDRTINSVDVDDYSTDQKCYARGGNSVFDIDSTTGIMTMNGNTPRYYCYLNHTNVEVTAYGKRGSESSYKSYQGLSIVARSTHKDYSTDYCQAKGYYFKLYNDGRACFLKEFIHSSSCLIYTASSNNPCVTDFDSSSTNGGVVANKWYGIKFVIQNDEINNKVNLRGYVDFTDGLNGGNWQLLLEYNDTNQWVAEVESSEQGCMDNCGYNGDENWSQQSNSIFLRSSYVNNYQWKYFTMREIIPTSTSSSTSSTTTRLPSTSTSTTTTTTTTNAPTNGNIIITNKGSTQQWWVAFFISNIDLSCGGTITNVEITDNNHVGTWIAFDDNQWGYYSFPHGGNKFVEPISVRITKSYNTVSESIVANDLVSLTGDETFDFGSNFCLTSSTTTTKQPSKNPSSTPSKFPTEPPTHFPTLKPSENPTLFPSKNPTLFPSKNPSKNPIVSPTKNPTFNPSENPTLFPSENPTSIPSKNPIVSPTKNPTLFPSKPPTLNPSENGEMTCNSVIDWKYEEYSSALVNAWNENTMSNIYTSEAEDKFLTEYPQCGNKNSNKLEYYYYFQKIETKLTIKMHICCGTEKTFGCCYDLPCNYANVYKANQAVINDKYHKNAHNTTSNKNNNVFDIKQYIIFCILGLLIICCGCGIIQLIIYRKNKSLKVNKKQIELANVIEMNDINGGQLPGPQNVQMPSIGNMNEMTDGTTVIQTQMTCTDSADLPTVMQPQMQINVTEITQPKIL